jgi:hypothetical protein
MRFKLVQFQKSFVFRRLIFVEGFLCLGTPEQNAVGIGFHFFGSAGFAFFELFEIDNVTHDDASQQATEMHSGDGRNADI